MNHRLDNRLIALGALIVIVHAALLFVVMPALSNRLAPSYNQNKFTDGYDDLAANLLAGNGYRFYPDTAKTLMREPGYPVFVAGLWLVFGRSFMVVKITNMILALSTAWLMVRLAEKLPPDVLPRNGLLLLAPPLLFLFHPATLTAESRGGVEIVFALMVTLLLLSLYRAMETDRWWDYAASGIVLGITVLVRSTPMLFPLFLLMYLLLFERRRVAMRTICRNIAVLIVSMLAVLSPWIIRNYSLTGAFVPTASVLGISAHAGQYIGAHIFEGKPMWLLDREASRERDRLAMKLGYAFEDGAQGYYQSFYKSQDEVKFSKYLTGLVAAEYRRSPMLFARCLGQNVFNFWFAGKTWAATAANAVIQLPYLVFALIGMVYSVKNKERAVVPILILFIGYVMAVHLPILAQARYSMPLLPLVSILATVGLVAVRKRSIETTATSTVSFASTRGDRLRDVVSLPVSKGSETGSRGRFV
jgi:4-amino-4-deoxy-L-arabinose transferase-like glycosyltransferase